MGPDFVIELPFCDFIGRKGNDDRSVKNSRNLSSVQIILVLDVPSVIQHNVKTRVKESVFKILAQ